MAKAKATAAQDPDLDKVLHLKPEDILARDEDNIRISLRDGDVERMIASIVEQGGVQEPISVERITPVPKSGPKLKLLKGFIRHAAVSKMNLSGAGITLPALVRTVGDETARLKTQIAENVARASLSPIDIALSIQKLLAAGVSRTDIRAIFARAGGEKGATVSPMTNSWLNIHLNMLELPENIQDAIHDGKVTAWGAYELGKVDPDRLQTVFENATALVEKQAKREETDEERFLKAEQADAKEQEKADADARALEAAKADVASTDALKAEKLTALRAAQAVEYDPADKEAKKAHDEGLSSAETDYKAAQGLYKKASNKVAKLLKGSTAAEELKDKLAKAREEPAKAVGPADIKKAAQADKAATGDTTGGAVALTAAEIKQALKDIAKGTENPAIIKVVGIISDVTSGKLTPKLALADLEKLLKIKAKA